MEVTWLVLSFKHSAKVKGVLNWLTCTVAMVTDYAEVLETGVREQHHRC